MADYEKRKAEFGTLMAAVEAAADGKGELQSALANLGNFMAKYPNAKTHTPTDPNNLPLTISWDLGANGSIDGTGACITKTYPDNGVYRVRIIATHRVPSKASCADSESRILAMKKFSCVETSRLIGARQNRIFARIAEG